MTRGVLVKVKAIIGGWFFDNISDAKNALEYLKYAMAGGGLHADKQFLGTPFLFTKTLL
jgi:hypothetical protein